MAHQKTPDRIESISKMSIRKMLVKILDSTILLFSVSALDGEVTN
jgi:hypothetical protein